MIRLSKVLASVRIPVIAEKKPGFFGHNLNGYL